MGVGSRTPKSRFSLLRLAMVQARVNARNLYTHLSSIGLLRDGYVCVVFGINHHSLARIVMLSFGSRLYIIVVAVYIYIYIYTHKPNWFSKCIPRSVTYNTPCIYVIETAFSNFRVIVDASSTIIIWFTPRATAPIDTNFLCLLVLRCVFYRLVR